MYFITHEIQISVSLNEVVRGRSCFYELPMTVSHFSGDVESWLQRSNGPQSLTYLLSAPLQKKFADSCLKAVIPRCLGELFIHAFVLPTNIE